MKYLQRKHISQGAGGGYWVKRVVEDENADGELTQHHSGFTSTKVASSEPVSDWVRDENQEA